MAGEISAAVSNVHKSLAWEVGPGKQSRYSFCVSPEGNPALRQVALRWLEAAPPPDDDWEYYASKQPGPSNVKLDVAGRELSLHDMRAISSWDDARRRVNVRLWHPMFPGAPDHVLRQVMFIFLDNLLGEDDVERWIGTIDALPEPSGGRTPDELKNEIERRKGGPFEEDTWVVGTLTRENGSVTFVTANAALKRIDYPYADHHVSIEVHFGGDRLPTDQEAEVLNAEEDDLVARFGEAATFAARTTDPGVRTLHFVAVDTEVLRPAIDAWAAAIPDSITPGQSPRRLKVNFDRDIEWAFQRELGIR